MPSDSIRHALSDAGWGHALAAMGAAMEEAQTAKASLAQLLAALPTNACHEIVARDKGGAAALLGFGAMLGVALAKARDNAPCFFVRELRRSGGLLYPPGLAQLGIDPALCFSVHAPDLLAALKATADIARSGAAGAVLVEVEGNPRLLDLTASRRLALAAEKSGTSVLLLRTSAHDTLSAAYSRWQVAPAPSPPLLADAPGGPAFAVTLLRHRRMMGGQAARLTWNAEERRFDAQQEAPHGSAPALASSRTTGQDIRPDPRWAA